MDPLDAVYDLLLAGARRAAQADGDHPRLHGGQQREAFAHPLCARLGRDDAGPDGPLAGSFFHGAYTWASWFYRFTVGDESC